MAQYETYRSNAAEAPIMRKWIVRGLLVSLILHGALIAFFQFKQLDNFAMTSAATLVPPRFVVNKVAIDPKLLEEPDEKKVALPVKPPSEKIMVPSEKPKPEEIVLKPTATEVTSPLLADKPKTSVLNWEKIAQAEAESAGRSDKTLGTIAAALLNSGVKSPRQPTIKIPAGAKRGAGLGEIEGIPGRQSIDDALAKAGSPLAAKQPVAMPGGALFQHDEAVLGDASVAALKKIGQLVSLYPNARFIISGHTDWTGTQEYNLRLSERRAEAVKEWLVNVIGVAPERIQTVGRGTEDAVVPADRSVDEQQPNRRVEIVIKTNTN